MTLSDSLRGQIEEDIVRVETRRNSILQGLKRNERVWDNDYLTPTTELCDLSHGDPRGELHYYNQIRQALGCALRVGAIPGLYMDYIIRAPEGIRDLLERTDSRVA